MPKDTMKRLINQEENRAFVEQVDKLGVSHVTEVLQDTKYPWVERKKKTLRLADIYKLAGYVREVEMAKSCARQLEYFAMKDGRRTLQRAIFCKLRLCPMCGARRAKKAALQLSKALTWVEEQHPGVQYLFLTLTVKNCKPSELGDTLTLLLTAFSKLRRHRPVARAIKGWYRAVEITRSKGLYHPHIHMIIAVEPDYFERSKGLYLTQKDWEAHWQSALGVTYKPRVDIRAAHKRGEKKAELAAAQEAAKYATKDSDYLAPNIPEAEAVEVVKTYTEALRGRRLIAVGGWMKDAMQALNLNPEDDDLVHINDDAIREDVAELVEVYRWSFGLSDYRLLYREEK